MGQNWISKGLLISALGVLPVAGAWAQTPEAAETERDAGPRTQAGASASERGPRGDFRRGPRHRGEGRRDSGRRGPEGGVQRGPGKGREGNREGKGQHGEFRKGGRFDGKSRNGARRRGNRSRGGEFRRGGRRDDRRGWEGYGRRGYYDGRDWGRVGNRDAERWGEAPDRGVVSGVVTSIVADNSIGVRAEDGAGFWARLPESQASGLKVGQRVELSGQWRDGFFVARSVRGRE